MGSLQSELVTFVENADYHSAKALVDTVAQDSSDGIWKNAFELIKVLVDGTTSGKERAIQASRVIDKLNSAVRQQTGSDIKRDGLIIVDAEHPHGFMLRFEEVIASNSRNDSDELVMLAAEEYLREHYEISEEELATLMLLSSQATGFALGTGSLQRRIAANLPLIDPSYTTDGENLENTSVKQSAHNARIVFDKAGRLKEASYNATYTIMHPNVRDGAVEEFASTVLTYSPKAKKEAIVEDELTALPGNQSRQQGFTFKYRAHDYRGYLPLSRDLPLLEATYVHPVWRFIHYLQNNKWKLLLATVLGAGAAVTAPVLWPAYAAATGGYFAVTVVVAALSSTTLTVLAERAKHFITNKIKAWRRPNKRPINNKNLEWAARRIETALLTDNPDSHDTRIDFSQKSRKARFNQLITALSKADGNTLLRIYHEIFKEHKTPATAELFKILILSAEQQHGKKIQSVRDFALVHKVQIVPVHQVKFDTTPLVSTGDQVFHSFKRQELIGIIGIIYNKKNPGNDTKWQGYKSELQRNYSLHDLKALLGKSLLKLSSEELLGLYKDIKLQPKYTAKQFYRFIADVIEVGDNPGANYSTQNKQHLQSLAEALSQQVAKEVQTIIDALIAKFPNVDKAKGKNTTKDAGFMELQARLKALLLSIAKQPDASDGRSALEVAAEELLGKSDLVLKHVEFAAEDASGLKLLAKNLLESDMPAKKKESSEENAPIEPRTAVESSEEKSAQLDTNQSTTTEQPFGHSNTTKVF